MTAEKNKVEFQIINQRLVVSTEKHPFMQGAVRSLLLEATELHIARGYRADDGKLVKSSRISGAGRVSRGDSIGRAGWKGSTKDISFSIRAHSSDVFLAPHSSAENTDLVIVIGFIDKDPEISFKDSHYFAEVYVPPAIYQELVADYDAGLVSRISLFANTNMWIHEFDEHTPPSGWITWYLGPERNGRSSETAHGTLSSLSWSGADGESAIAKEADSPLDEVTPEVVIPDPMIEAEGRKLVELKQLNRVLRYGLGAIALLLLVLVFRV
ncbi:hypothetical protein SAMN05519104_0581 [Rhizobiales bacterium GAS188]|nr:hypothetical protein SAMN05519104_0581 [Rhizobiales bacterium GAS188]